MNTASFAASIASSVPLILEAALRALLAAVAVWTGLRLLRVSNVPAQKVIWGLVLVTALAMPLAPHWNALPALAALRIPAAALLSAPSRDAEPTAISAQPDPALMASSAAAFDSAEFAAPAAIHPARARSKRSMRQSAIPSLAAPSIDLVATPSAVDSNAVARFESNITAHTAQQGLPSIPAASPRQSASLRLATAASFLYLAVFAALLLRILIGLAAAFRLWITAEPIPASDAVCATPLRFSKRVASPINIGSGILLPADYAEWDEHKLRVVLAHERSHIRQGDFYLQLLAGLYAAFFWFSPLGWWLKRKLSELGEAISDRAGLEEAASRSSYAQLLLEFATLPRPTLTGVAMARSSHLTQRIERLLNESSFRQAFAAGGRRTLFAVLLVPVALFAATAMVRVEAAVPQAPVAPQAQVTGQSTPEQVTEPSPAAAPAPVVAPDSAPMQAPPPPPANAVDPGSAPMAPMPPMPQDGAMPPMPPMPPVHVRVNHDDIHVHIDPKDLNVHVDAKDINTRIDPQIRMEIAAARDQMRSFRNFNFDFGGPGEPYALVGDPGSKQRFDGHWDDDSTKEIEKARKTAHGHFLWFRHDGKSYIVDDPKVVAELEAMNKPLDELREQMRTLGDQMRAMGEKQRAEGQKMRDLSVPTPDLSKELEELNAAAASLKAKQGGTISQKELGDLQREFGRIQGELGALQGKIGAQQGAFGSEMGKFGGQMGELGGQMGKLGGQMGKLARENHEKVHSIIDESLQNGHAKPVE